MADSSKEMNAWGSFELMRSFGVAMCEKNNTALLKAIRTAGVDVNITDSNGRTLLMFAVYYAARCRDTVRPRMTEAIHCLLDMMYARAPYPVLQRAMHIHPTVSELIPTLLQDLKPLGDG